MSQARRELGLLTPRQLCDIRTVLVAHKAYVEGVPSDLASLFTSYATARTGDRITRQDQQLRPPAVRTAAGQRSLAYRAATLINALPEGTRDLNMSSFNGL